MPTPTYTPAAQIDKHILENASISFWLRSTFKLAIRRDPVDALQDAEMLVAALRSRSLDAYSVGAPFNAQLTVSLLQQHADAIGQLAKDYVQDLRPYDKGRVKGDINWLVMHIHAVARHIIAARERLNSAPAARPVGVNVH